MKNIAVLGSTGSIGTQTLDVVRANPERLCVKALAAGYNITQLESQIREFHPQIAAVWDEEKAKELRIRTADLPVKIVSGMEGLLEIAQMEEAEVLVTAIVGMIGIRPTIAAIKAGKDIALANKETLVTAGHIIMPLAKEYNVKILPVDSEHSAIFQCLHGENRKEIEKLLITAKVYALNSAGTRIDVSHGYEYYFDVNDSHNMLNWVYEEHYNMTCVRCEGYSVDDYHGAWFGGYWNPDI